jgi:hypothetical protein
MKNIRKSPKQLTRRQSLAGRLMAYSIMAGAAVVLTPAADGAMVSPSSNCITGPFASNYALTPVQSQQVQSQRTYRSRHAGMREMANGTNSTCHIPPKTGE